MNRQALAAYIYNEKARRTHIKGGGGAPTLRLSSLSIAEDATIGAIVGALSVASLPDGVTVSGYSITADPDSKFDISGSNLITDATLDYETATSHSVTIRATLSEGDPVDRTFAISVTDVAEPPAQFATDDWSVADAATDGEIVITLTSLPDPGDASITDVEYQIDGGSWVSLGGIALDDYTISGLTNNVEVDVAIRAVSASGSGTASATKAVTPTDAFTPASLFASGEDGLFLDFTDTSSVFGSSDFAQTGVAASWLIDKADIGDGAVSDYITSATELVTNGTFDSDVSGWTVVDGTLTWNAGGYGVIEHTAYADVRQSLVVTSGKLVVSVDEFIEHVPGDNAAIVKIGSTAGGTDLLNTILGVGEHKRLLQMTSSLLALRYQNAQNTFKDTIGLDNVSCKELPGLSGKQTNSSFRAILQTSSNRLAFDGADDRYDIMLNPTTTGSIAVRMRGGTASRVAVGAQGASDGRCYVGLASDGAVAGGIGTQGTSTIKGSTDRTSAWVTAVLTWNGTTVKLYENGNEVYSAAQSGAVTTSVPFTLGALNNNGTPATFWDGDISHCIVTNDVLTAAEAASLHTAWSS